MVLFFQITRFVKIRKTSLEMTNYWYFSYDRLNCFGIKEKKIKLTKRSFVNFIFFSYNHTRKSTVRFGPNNRIMKRYRPPLFFSPAIIVIRKFLLLFFSKLRKTSASAALSCRIPKGFVRRPFWHPTVSSSRLVSCSTSTGVYDRFCTPCSFSERKHNEPRWE